MLVLEGHLRPIAVTLKQNLLHVRTRVVEQELGIEVVESRRLWLELKADESERFSTDLTDSRESLEGAGCVLHNLVLNGRVASVVQLDSLIDRLGRAARREGNLGVAHLDHGDEWLGTWSKRVSRDTD